MLAWATKYRLVNENTFTFYSFELREAIDTDERMPVATMRTRMLKKRITFASLSMTFTS